MTRVCLCILVLASTAQARGTKWETVARDDGVKVMMREVPGRNFPTIRSIVVLDENFYDVLGVLSDVKRSPGAHSRLGSEDERRTREPLLSPSV